MKWYRKAAEQGHVVAQTYLAFHYQNGEGVAKNQAEAVKWYGKAAAQGDAAAQTNLANCYAEAFRASLVRERIQAPRVCRCSRFS